MVRKSYWKTLENVLGTKRYFLIFVKIFLKRYYVTSKDKSSDFHFYVQIVFEKNAK